MAKGHVSPRPSGPPDKKIWNDTTGPSTVGGNKGPAGSKGGPQRNIVNTLAMRRFSQNIGRARGGAAKQ